jgi:prepilin peptidase CpaA
LSFEYARYLVVLVVAGAGCWTDLTEKRVPNPLTAGAAVSGMVLFYLDDGLGGVVNSLAGLICAGGIFLFFYALGGFGGGDVKLMGGLGALVGFPACFRLVLYVALAGSVVVVVVLLRHRALWEGIRSSFLLVFRGKIKSRVESADNDDGEEVGPIAVPRTIPYGVAVMMGACMLFLQGGF